MSTSAGAAELRRLALPAALGLGHGFSDGAAGFLLAGLAVSVGLPAAGLLVLGYNLLAFAAQPLAGWLTDRLRHARAVALGGLLLSGVAVLLGRSVPAAAALVAGLASALLHVSSGALAVRATPGRAAGPGLFAAPGAVGLALGGAWALARPTEAWPFLAGLLACGAWIALLDAPALPGPGPAAPEPALGTSAGQSQDWILLGLLAAIALRSTAWSTLQYVLQGQVETLVWLALAAGAGKALGGALADRLGWRRWTVGALLISASLLAGLPNSLAGLCLAVALLQSATPAAIAAMAGAMPRQPATAAGLSLGFATALGGLPLQAGFGAWLNSPAVLGALTALAAVLAGLTLRPELRTPPQEPAGS